MVLKQKFHLHGLNSDLKTSGLSLAVLKARLFLLSNSFIESN